MMAGADDGDETDALRLTRDLGDRGPSLSQRLSERLDRLSFASPFHRMRLKGRYPLKLIAVPIDPIPGNPATAARLKGGRLFLGGYGQGMLDGRLDSPDAPEGWRHWLHSWGWLRDLAAADSLGAAEVARSEALSKRWLARFHEYDEEAWAPAATGTRILMACMHAPLVIPGKDHVHRSAVLNGIARWSRHLDRAAPRMLAGLPKVEATAGLIGSALILPGGEERLERSLGLLEDALAAVLDPEGAPLARSPLELARLGDLMLTLEAFHAARMQKPCPPVARALEQVRDTLSALAMGDGLPSPWHGGQPDLAQMQRLGARPSDRPLPRSSGFQRLAAGDVRVMVDAGPPPPARINPATHASSLAFTFTDGARAIVTSCGGGRGADGLRAFPPELVAGLRSTAGHSALVLADTNSSRLPDGGPRKLGGVEEVRVEARATSEGQWLECRHDGWRRRFGYEHLRRLWLSPDGADLRGEDQLIPARGALALGRPGPALPIAVRFHLGAGATATPTQDGKGALIRVPGTGRQPDLAWGFRASFAHAPGLLAVEPSLLVDSDGQTHEIQQILLTSLVDPG
ncbi:MAG: heparinase II/III family protein, partial [Sandaracinobacteroides sp.]